MIYLVDWRGCWDGGTEKLRWLYHQDEIEAETPEHVKEQLSKMVDYDHIEVETIKKMVNA